MAFTQRYKKNIMDLLNKNIKTNKDAKNITLKKLNIKDKNNLHILNLKHSIYQKDNINKRAFTPIINNNISNIISSSNVFSIFNNKKIKTKLNKQNNNMKIYNKNIIPKYKIHYRNIRKNNCFSNDKTRFDNINHYKKMKLISGGDDVIIKDIDKNVRFLLLKNDSKQKMMNKIERLNFYKKINKVFDDINIINKKYFYFNKSLTFFTPLDSIYKKMEL